MSRARELFREVISRPTCTLAANIFDPLSARIAHMLGYEICVLSGSVGKAANLGVPDIVLSNMSDVVDLAADNSHRDVTLMATPSTVSQRRQTSPNRRNGGRGWRHSNRGHSSRSSTCRLAGLHQGAVAAGSRSAAADPTTSSSPVRPLACSLTKPHRIRPIADGARQ